MNSNGTVWPTSKQVSLHDQRGRTDTMQMQPKKPKGPTWKSSFVIQDRTRVVIKPVRLKIDEPPEDNKAKPRTAMTPTGMAAYKRLKKAASGKGGVVPKDEIEKLDGRTVRGLVNQGALEWRNGFYLVVDLAPDE